MVLHIQASDLQVDARATAFDLLVSQQVVKLDSDPEAKAAGEQWMMRNAHRILLVIDGLDQCLESPEHKGYGRVNYGFKATANTILANIFSGHLFRGMKILSTSRWFVYWKLREEYRPGVTAALRGFGDEEFKRVLEQLCTKNTAEKIIDLLKRNSPDLLQLYKMPLFTVYIAAIFGDIKHPPDKFSGVILCLLQHIVKRMRKEGTDDKIDSLAKLGFEGMKANRFTFTTRFLKELGLKMDDITSAPVNMSFSTVQFVHQSVQELFAVLHLLQMQKQKFEAFLTGDLNKPEWEVVEKMLFGITTSLNTDWLEQNILQDIPTTLQEIKKLLLKQLSKMLKNKTLEDMRIVSLLHECGPSVISECKDMINYITTDRALKPGDDYVLASVMQQSLPLRKVDLHRMVLNPKIITLLVEAAKKSSELFTITDLEIGEYIRRDDYKEIQLFFEEVPVQSVLLSSSDDIAQSFLGMSDIKALKNFRRIGMFTDYSKETFRALARFICRQHFLIYLNIRKAKITEEKLATFSDEITTECTVHRLCLQENENMDEKAYKILPEILQKLHTKYFTIAARDVDANNLAAFNDSAKRIDLRLSAIVIAIYENIDKAAFDEIAMGIELSKAFFLQIWGMNFSKAMMDDLCCALMGRNIQVKKFGIVLSNFFDSKVFSGVVDIMLQLDVKSLQICKCKVNSMLDVFLDEIKRQKFQFPIMHYSEKDHLSNHVLKTLASLIRVANITEFILGAQDISVSQLRHMTLEKCQLRALALYSVGIFNDTFTLFLTKVFARLHGNRMEFSEYEGGDLITRELSDFSYTMTHGLYKANWMAISNGKMPDIGAMQHIGTLIGHPVMEVLWLDECYLTEKHYQALAVSLKTNKFSMLRHLILSQKELKLTHAEIEEISGLLKFILFKLELRGVELDFSGLKILQVALDNCPHENTEVVLERGGLARTLKKGYGNRILVSLSAQYEMDSKGGKVIVGNAMVTFEEGTLETRTIIDAKLEIDSSRWPQKEKYLCISPILYLGKIETQKKPASVQLTTSCINGDVHQKRTVDVLHRPRGVEDWKVIDSLPFNGDPTFRFDCSDFSPIVIALPWPFRSSAQYAIQGAIFVDRREDNFVISFRLREHHEGLQLTTLERKACINTLQTRIDDRIKITINCEDGDFRFGPRNDFEFRVDDDFVRSNYMVQFQCRLQYHNLGRRGQCNVPVNYSVFKNDELLGNYPMGFNYQRKPPHQEIQDLRPQIRAENVFINSSLHEYHMPGAPGPAFANNVFRKRTCISGRGPCAGAIFRK